MIRLLMIILFFSGAAQAAGLDFLCGTDEDGCFPDHYDYCICMPYDSETANQPYCLNFNNLSCVPLSSKPDCRGGEIYGDQATCLAVAFQSEPTPVCPLKTEQFCRDHAVPLCEKDGGMNTCR